MKLYTRTTYRLDCQDFDSLGAARQYVTNEIGKILGKTPLRMDSKQALAVFETIISNRQRLVDLLTIELENEDWQGETRNILDL